MSYNTPWPRVYPGLSKLPRNEVRRLTIELPEEDARIILAVSVNSAIFSLIAQTAFQKYVKLIKSNGFTYTDAETLTQHILCDGANSGTNPSTPGITHPGGVTGVHEGVKDPSDISASTGKEVAAGGRDGGKEGSKVRQGRTNQVTRRNDGGTGRMTT